MAGDRAVKSAVCAYTSSLKAVIQEGGGLPVEADVLWGMHASCQKQALAVFRAEAVLEAEETREYVATGRNGSSWIALACSCSFSL